MSRTIRVLKFIGWLTSIKHSCAVRNSRIVSFDCWIYFEKWKIWFAEPSRDIWRHRSRILRRRRNRKCRISKVFRRWSILKTNTFFDCWTSCKKFRLDCWAQMPWRLSMVRGIHQVNQNLNLNCICNPTQLKCNKMKYARDHDIIDERWDEAEK